MADIRIVRASWTRDEEGVTRELLLARGASEARVIVGLTDDRDVRVRMIYASTPCIEQDAESWVAAHQEECAEALEAAERGEWSGSMRVWRPAWPVVCAERDEEYGCCGGNSCAACCEMGFWVRG